MFNAAAVEKVGTIKAFGGSNAPDGWLFCDGSAISRTTYAALFAVIGTSYGAGDGTTTFNIPNGVVPIGNTTDVAGNGKTLGLYSYNNQDETAGLVRGINSGGIGSGTLVMCPNTYNTNVNLGSSGIGSSLANISYRVGVTTDGAKSGLIVNLANAISATQAIIKY